MLIGLLTSCQNSANKTEQSTSSQKELLEFQQNDTSGVIQLTGPWNLMGHTMTPNLFSDGKKLYVSWIELNDPQAYLWYSALDNQSWDEKQLISQGDDWFINWADFPQFAVHGEHMMATFLQKSADDTYAYDIYYTLKQGQNNWKEPKKLHRDDTKAEHGFVSIAPGNQGFLVSWLDGRNTVLKENNHSKAQNQQHLEHSSEAMTLRSTAVHFDGSLGKESLIDSRVCDCCQTTVVWGQNNEAFVAYRGRSETEVRDVLVRQGSPETGWSAAISTKDNWLIAGCPVNGPSIDLNGPTLVLAWFTAGNDEPRVQVAFSSTENMGFSEIIRMDAGNAIGRVDVVQLTPESAIVTWVEPMGDMDYIRAQWVDNTGNKGPLVTVSKTSSNRATGFPRMVSHKEHLYLVTTDLKPDKSKEVSLKSWPLSMMLPQNSKDTVVHE